MHLGCAIASSWVLELLVMQSSRSGGGHTSNRLNVSSLRKYPARQYSHSMASIIHPSDVYSVKLSINYPGEA